MTYSTAFIAAAAVLCATACLFGQEQHLVEPGVRVRVTAPDCGLDRHPTVFDGWRSDTMVLGTITCPLHSLTGLDVHAGRQSNLWRGARIGLISGAAIGGVLGLFGGDAGCCSGDVALLVGAVFGAGGAVVGGGVGTLIKTDHWVEVPLERLRGGLAPPRDGKLSLGVSMRF